MKYPLKQGLRWCMLSMAVSASAQVSAPIASTQLPTGGKVMSGTTSIQSVGNVLNINQSSQRSAINWNTFNVGSGAKVNFIQPSASSVTLNRVLDTNGSQILGSINANGQVFISNPNGVLFGPNSQVNVGGLIATTQNITVDDFMAGKSTFEGTGAAGSVVNQGTLEAALGGYIALLAPSVRNEGVVLAREGTVAFAAGDKTVVQFNGPQLVSVMVDRSVLDALVENKQIVRADGGLVIFSARSANAVLSSVIKNTGTIQAQTIENKNGRILLIGDMQKGSITVDGKLDASAPTQGDGGFIETSGAQVKIANSAVVTTLAKNGKTGTWLVDPHDYTVAASGGDQTGTQLSTSLGTTNITLQSASGAQTGSGNININDGVSWSADTTLTLTATNNVNVNANITATGAAAGLAINPNTASLSELATSNGVFNIASGASISLPNVLSSSTTALVISNTPYKVINSLSDLQGMNSNLNGKYALGKDIDATLTSAWNSGTGFTPIGGNPTAAWTPRPTGFSGELNGLGHSINNLKVNYGENYNFVGMFSLLTTNSVVSNLNLSQANIQGGGHLGALAGVNNGLVYRVTSSGTVSSTPSQLYPNLVSHIGGLVGINEGIINDSSSTASVTGTFNSIGGLVGANYSEIRSSFSSGNVQNRSSGGYGHTGGLVGYAVSGSQIINSFSTSSVSGNDSLLYFGGLVGANEGVISTSYSTGSVTLGANATNVGGLVGTNNAGTVSQSYSTGTVSVGASANNVGGLLGTNLGSVSGSYSSSAVTTGDLPQAVGGLIGLSNTGSIISSSKSTGAINISGRGVLVGGFVGNSTGGTTITNSYSNSNINATGVARYAGGFVGNADNTSITNAYSTGGITAATGSDHVGGFVGNAYSSLTSITNAYSTGSVSTSGGLNIAGFAGGVESSPTITGSYWNTSTSGQTVGAQQAFSNSTAVLPGLSGLNSDGMKILSNFTGWDSAIWTKISSLNNDFPVLSSGIRYVRPSTSSNVYGSSPSTSYSIYDAYSGGNLITGLGISGAPTWNATTDGVNYSALTNTTSAGTNYSVSYSTGLTFSNNFYGLTSGGPINWTVNKAPLNTALAKTYDGTATFSISNSSSLTLTGTVNGDATPTVTSGTVDVGSKSATSYSSFVNNSFALSNANYTLTGGTFSAIINKKPLNITSGISVDSKDYDGTSVATVNTSAVITDGKITGDVISGGTVTGAFSSPNAASGIPVTLTNPLVFGDDAANYLINITQPTITGTIRQVPATVSAGSLSTTYTGTTQFIFSDNFTASGLVNGETKSVLTGVSTSGQGINAGTYATTSSGTATNYLLSFTPGVLTISPKPLNTSVTKTYDGSSIFSTGFTLSGAVGSETPTATGSATASSQNTATYTAFSTNGLTLSSSNYTLTGGAVSATISPKSLNTSVTKTYDGSNVFSTGFTLSGAVGSETPTATGSATASSQNTATYTAFSTNGLTLSSSNYTLTGGTVSATISPKPLNTSVTKTYDGSNVFSTGFTLSGAVGSETPTVSGSATASSQNAGLYSAFSNSNLVLNNSNYTLTGGTVSATINKANATVIGLSGSTEFDGFTKTLNGFTAIGLVNRESTGDIAKSASNINGLSASVSGRFSGTYLNTPYGTANNYNLNFVSGQLLITGCPGGPPCSAIGPQTTVSNITPVVIPAMTAPSFSSAIVTTASPTNSAAPVINFASSSGGGSFGSGGGSTTISNTNATNNSVNPTTVTTSAGNPTTNASPAVSTTTTTIINAGATTANPTTNVVNIATNAPSGSTTPTQVNVAQGNAAPTSSPNTVTTTAQNPTSPVAISTAPNNTGTATVSATPNPTTTVNTVNTTNNVNVQASAGTNQAPTNTTSTPTNNTAIPQPATGVVVANNNTNAAQVNVAATQPNVVNPQRLADILSKKDPVEISSALPPTQVAQLSPEQVAPLIDSLNMRQLMSLTNEQIAKFEPARQAELLNIIKVLKDNPEKAAEKAFTPTDKTFAQLAANGLLKEQIDTLSSRVTQINQNRTTVNIDTPQKLAELLTKKDPVEIATALPSNQVAQLTPEQAAPLISSLTVRQLLALTNEQISKFDRARQTELLNIINVIKNNPEKAADKAYTAIDKTTAQYVANGLMKDQIDALASKVTQITQNKTTINIDTPQKLAEILSKNNAVEVATALPSNVVPQLTSDQVAPLINALSVKQLLSLTNEQMSKLDPARLAELLNIIKGLKDTPEKAIDKTYTPEDKAVAQYAANGLLKDPIERLSLRANYIANNKSVDPLNKELADLTNPPVPANVPVARNAPNQANRPLNAAQLAAQNANRETPNLTPAQVAALNPKDLGPLLSQLNANQLMAITNAQMASLEGSYLNQLTILLNFVQDRASNSVANATPAAGGNRVNNTNIFINQPVAKLAGAALLADQPNAALPTAPIPAPNPVLAGVGLTPKQVSELDPTQLAALINQLNANQLMAITNTQMARMDGRALNQLTILMNFVQQRTANNNGTANGNNPANAGTNTNTNINVFVNQPVSRLASNALLNEQPKPNAPVGSQSFTQTNITVNLTPRQISELDPTQLAPLISQLNANQLMAITNTQMARMDSQSINQLNILMNFVQQRALNSNTNTTIYINQPVSQIAAASLMNDQPLPTQIAGAAPAPIATVPLSPLQIAGLTPSQVAPLLNRMNSRQLMAVTDTQMASLDSANLNQLITLLNFIQDSARTSPIVTNNFANRPVAGFLPPELNTSQTVTQP